MEKRVRGRVRVRVRLEDEETSGGGKGHKLEDETRVRTDYLSFLAFLEAGQIKVSRVLIWGRRHDAKQIQTVPVYPGLPALRGIGVLGLGCRGCWGVGVRPSVASLSPSAVFVGVTNPDGTVQPR